MTLAELKARLEELKASMRAIHEGAGDAALDETRQAEWDEADTERLSTIDQIAAAEKRMAAVADLAASPATTERGTDTGAPAFHKDKGEELFDLNDIRKMSYSGDDFLARVEDNARHAIERATYGVKNKEEAQERAEELLDTVDNSSRELAKRMLITGSKEYASGFAKMLRHGSDAFCTQEERQALIRAVQTLGTDAGGGYAVPFQLDPTVILTSAGVKNPIRDLARVETIVGKEWQGVTSAGTSVTRAGENAVAPASNFTLAQPKVRTNRVQGYTVFSIEIDLSWGALQSEITKMLVDAKGQEENSFISGAGDGITDGQAPQGVNVGLTSANDTELALHTAFTQADLFSLEEGLDARWEANASFLAHKTVYNKVRQFPTDGSAGSLNNLWTDFGAGLTESTRNTRRLLDYPTYRSAGPNGMPTLATALAAGAHSTGADTIAILGDFSQFMIVDRIGMSVELVPTVLDVGTGRPIGQRGVYTYWMNNSKVLVPGAFRRLIAGDN